MRQGRLVEDQVLQLEKLDSARLRVVLVPQDEFPWLRFSNLVELVWWFWYGLALYLFGGFGKVWCCTSSTSDSKPLPSLIWKGLNQKVKLVSIK